MHLRTFLLVCIVTCVACGEISNKDISTEDSQIILIDVDKARPARLSEFFQNIHYIPLRTDKYQSVGRIEKLIVTDRYIAILDVSNKSVWVFAREGNLVNQILIPQGRGPGEITFLGDFIIDKNHRIHAMGAYKIVVYSMGGALLHEIIINYPAYKFTYLDEAETYVLFTSNSLYQNVEIQNTGTNLIFVDASGEFLAQALPIDFDKRGLGVLVYNHFPVYGNEVLFFGNLDFVIYEVGGEEISTRYKLDFGPYAVPPDIYSLRSGYNSGVDFWNREIMNRKYVNSVSFYNETDQIIYFVFNVDQVPYKTFYSKKNGTSTVASQLINDIDYGLAPVFRAAAGEKLFAVIPPYKILKRLDVIREKHPQRLRGDKMNNFMKLANNLTAYDNPVIMVGTLKR